MACRSAESWKEIAPLPILPKPNFHGLFKQALQSIAGHIGQIRGTISCREFTEGPLEIPAAGVATIRESWALAKSVRRR